MGIIFPLLIEKVLHKRKNPALVLGSVVGVFALFLLIVGMYSSLLTIVIAYFLYSIIDTIIFPIDTMLANSMIEPKKRATMISIKSVIENLASIIGAPLM
ncbi:MAG: hypothetical protein LBG59_07645 [Candidatus Peribacteria bacterium]|jgi:predicted MFS family arabinose efflux permease|nr:hypothetical protein [Candidatus Peribacteria bacterium]